MVRRDHGRAGDARIFCARSGPANGQLRGGTGAAVRPLLRGRPLNGLGAVGAPPRAARRAVPRRQLPARADGARGRRPHQPGPPSPDELVPVSRARLTPVPPLPEPAVHDLGTRGHGGQSRHGVPVVPLSAPCALADHRLLERPAVRAEPLDGRVGRRGGAVPRVGGRHRLRDQGLRLGGLWRMDPTVGLVDAPAGVGLHLPGALVAARGLLGRPLHHADGGAALRDRVPRLRAPRRVALHRPLGPVATDRPRGGARGGGRAGVGLGHRSAAPAVPLGGAQSGAGGHRARERLRRTADADVAGHRQPLRQRPLAGLAARHHDPRGRRDRSLPGPLALVPGRPRPRGHLARHARHVVRADDLRVALRHCAGQQRHLHPALRNGPTAVGPPARRCRPRLARTARPGARTSALPRGPPRVGGAARPGGASSPACASSR